MDSEPDPEAGVRDSNWGDPRTRLLMQHCATDLAERSGFDVCAVAVVRPDDRYELVTVTGDHPGGKAMVGTGAVMEQVWKALREGTDHGPFTFLRAEEMSPETRALAMESDGMPDLPLPTDAETWHPLDVLVARVRDDSGATKGLAWLTRPLDMRRPDAARIREITESAQLPLASMLTVIEHESLSQRVRLLDFVRQLLHDSARHDERELVRLAADGIREAFGAATVGGQLFGWGWTGPLSERLDPDLRDALTDAAVRACGQGAVILIEPGQVWGDAALRRMEPALTEVLRAENAGVMVLAPVGTRDKAIGLMLLARTTEAPRWTDAESAAFVDLGTDLGRGIADARARARERALIDQLTWHESLRRNFATRIAHEFKTPLTVIRANAELLANEELSDGAAFKLEAIDRGVSRLMRLVNALATLAKVSDPGVEPTRTRVDLGAVLVDVTTTLRPVAERVGVVLETPECDEGVFVTGDLDELTRALTNIIDNAVKYTAPEGRVETWVSRKDACVVFGCRDDGLGISEADRAELFSPFFRSTNPEALDRPGTGLGLDIVRNIVERHSGSIAVESVLGSGSTFCIELPHAEPETGQDAGEEEPAAG